MCWNSAVPDKAEDTYIHEFSDASRLVITPELYIKAVSPKGIANQRQLVSNTRRAPREVSVLRLKLIAGYLLK